MDSKAEGQGTTATEQSVITPEVTVGPPEPTNGSAPEGTVALGPPTILPPSSPTLVDDSVLDSPTQAATDPVVPVVLPPQATEIPVANPASVDTQTPPMAQKEEALKAEPTDQSKKVKPAGKGRPQRPTFTFEECLADAQKYPSRTKWQFLSGKVYDYARKMKWLDKCCGHMTRKRVVHKRGYWTKERVGNFAKLYRTRTAWAGNHNQSYNYARGKGWLDELTQHMDKTVVAVGTKQSKKVKVKAKVKAKAKTKMAAKKTEAPKPLTVSAVRKSQRPPMNNAEFINKGRGYWNKKENVLACARRFQTRTQFAMMATTAYKKACEKGWVKDATAHMVEPPQVHLPHGYWTEERCADIAKKYKRRSVWAAFHPQSYNAARKNGWMDKLTAHMATPVLGRWSNSGKAPKQRATTSKKETAPKKEVAAKKAQTSTPPRPSAPMKVKTSAPSKEFEFTIKHADKMPRGYWTKARVVAVGRMFSSRSEWRDATPYIYNLAMKNGFLKSATRHMVDPKFMIRDVTAKARVEKKEEGYVATSSSTPSERSVENLSEVPTPTPVAAPAPVSAPAPVVAPQPVAQPAAVAAHTPTPAPEPPAQPQAPRPAPQPSRPAYTTQRPAPQPQKPAPSLGQRILRFLGAK